MWRQRLMDIELVRWVVMVAVPGVVAWLGHAVLKFIQGQQERADASQQAFLEHMKSQAERQMAAMEGSLRALKDSLDSHTEASKDNNRKLEALLQREEAEIALMQQIAEELKEQRRAR